MYAKLTGFVFTVLILVAVGTQSICAQYTADGEGFPLVSPITILSPANISYSSNEVSLGISFKSLLTPENTEITYSLDGKENNTIPLSATKTPREVTRTYANGTTVVVNSTSFMIPFTVTGSAVLPLLENGPHNITVYGKYTLNDRIGLDKKTVYFTVNGTTTSLNQEMEQISEFPEWTPLLLVVFIVIAMVIIYRYILNKLE